MDVLMVIAIWAVVFALIGLIVGFLFFKLAKNQIKVRCEKIPQLAKDYNPEFLSNKRMLVIWECVSCILSVLVYVLNYTDVVRILFGIVFMFCLLNIAAVDWSIRRIPNELLLIILVLSIIYDVIQPILYGGANKGDSIKNNLIFSALGIVLSFVVFAVPKKFGLYMGNGDIKLSAVVGSMLGIFGSLQAMVIMTLFMLVVLIILRITKKGGLRTKCPMGPALALGAFVSYLFPVVANRVTILW